MYPFIYLYHNQLVLIPYRLAVLQLRVCSIIQSTVQVLLVSLETFLKASSTPVAKTSQWDLKADTQIANIAFVALPPPNLMGVKTLLFCFLLLLIPANCLLTFSPMFEWKQLHCYFNHSLHQKQHCSLVSTPPRLITAAELAPWRRKHDERSPFADIILWTISPHPPINHPWAGKAVRSWLHQSGFYGGRVGIW